MPSETHLELIERLNKWQSFLTTAGYTSVAADAAEAATALQSLTSTIAGLEADAGRYRYLRSQKRVIRESDGNNMHLNDRECDRAIDAAISRARG